MRIFPLLLLVTSCAAPLRGALQPEGFEARKHELLEQAAEQWRVATDGALNVRLRDGEWTIEPSVIEGPATGRTHYFSGHVEIDATQIESFAAEHRIDAEVMFVHTVMHEIGHAAGIRGHVPGSPLMQNGSDATAVCVDSRALARMCEELECGPRAKATCDPRARRVPVRRPRCD